MTDRELMQQALDGVEALLTSMDVTHLLIYGEVDNAITALRKRLEQPEHDDPIGDAQAGLIAEQATRPCKVGGPCVPTQTGPCACKELPPPISPIVEQPQMQPCAGRNCGSTNPNLHSAECFEDYEKATGMSSVEHAVIAGALFDFMGWLTSRKERIVLSSSDNASPAVDAITEFAKMRGLSLADAKVTDWRDMTRGNDAA